jgi:hypothetical protein
MGNSFIHSVRPEEHIKDLLYEGVNGDDTNGGNRMTGTQTILPNRQANALNALPGERQGVPVRRQQPR